MITLNGHVWWRINNIVTLTSTNTDYILSDFSVNTVGGDNFSEIVDLNASYISTSSNINNLIDGDDSTFLQTTTGRYKTWGFDFKLKYDEWLTSITLKSGIGGREIQTADIYYSDDGITWTKYYTIKPMTLSGDSNAFTVDIPNLYELDVGLMDINKPLFYISAGGIPVLIDSSVKSYHNNISFLDVFGDNYTDMDSRTIRGTIYNIKNSDIVGVHLYEKPTKKLKSFNRIDIDGVYEFDKLTKGKSYFVTDNHYNLIYDTDYDGEETISGFIEGKSEPVEVILTDKFGNQLEIQNTTDFEFTDYKLETLQGSIKIGDTLTPVEYFSDQQRGYISASIVIGECVDSDFVIHCYRSYDKQFIGEYPIIDDRYTIDNLNLTQTYDIMLHDKNKIVETQVHSRRTPSIYQ